MVNLEEKGNVNMNIKNSIKRCIGAVMSCTIAVGTFGSAASMTYVRAEDYEKTYKIMCMGDSITHGYIDDNNGYRKYLCYYLQQNNISYDMVGANNSWSNEAAYDWNGTTITYDPAHCGYSGYAIKNYNGRTGLYETLFQNNNIITTYDPDIMLLQIGTNDLLDARLNVTENMGDITSQTTALQRLESLVDEIIANMDTTDVLFLASVPDIDADIRSDWLGAYEWIAGVDTNNKTELQAKVDEYVDTYNAGVKALVDKKKSEGVNIGFADINSVVDMKSGLYDGVHPNETGYAAMGKLWSNTIKNYLDGTETVETTTTTAETTTTTTTESTITETTTTDTTTESTTTTAETTTTIESTTTESTTESTTTSTETTTTTTTVTTTDVNKDLGDLNWDGQVNMSDCVVLRKYLVGVINIHSINYDNADMDGNGRINIFDASCLLEMLISKNN